MTKFNCKYIKTISDIYWEAYFKVRKLSEKIKQKEKEKWDL